MSLTPWTIEALDTLRTMHAEGKTFLEIGNAIGVTRSAIAGKVRRLKLPHRGPQFAAEKRWGKPREKSKTKRFSLKRASPKERKPPMFLRVVSVPDAKPVPLMERTGCCFPTTGEKPHLFCNEPIGQGDYCEFHFRVMYPRGKAA